jgi:hypothetical protein
MSSGHHAEREYPTYVSHPDHRLSEPGPAALALTVGAVAHSAAPSHRPGDPALRSKAIAPAGYLAPFSRTGPGIGTNTSRTNKPDLVASGGNWVHDADMNSVIQEDRGVGVVVPALGEAGRLFRVACGTSFAAPVVARCAADILASYPDASANLVRALLASAARPTSGAVNVSDFAERHRMYGFGRPSSDRAISSGSDRVTMTFDGVMPVDTAVIHPIPIPEEFAAGTRDHRVIQIAMAFDPPVRRAANTWLAQCNSICIARSTLRT